jgi:hypothetical protein
MLVGGALVCALFVIGCGKEGGAPAKNDKGATAADAAPAPKPKPKPTVFFVGGRNRLVVGDADGYRRLGGDDDQFFSIVAQPDGSAWISGSAGLHRYDAGELTVVDTGGLDKVSPVGVTQDGALWGLTEDKIARFDGKAWTSWGHDEIGATAPGNVGRFAVGPDGKAYVTRGGHLAIGDGTAWRAIAAPAGIVLMDAAVGGDGVVYAAGGPEKRTSKDKATIFALRDDALVEVGKIGSPSAYFNVELDGSIRIGVADGRISGGKIVKNPVTIIRAVAADGTVWGDVSSVSAVVAIAPDGKKTRYPAKGAFEADVRGVVPERGGRVWIVLENGLAVVDAGTLTLLPPETIPELPDDVKEITIGADRVPLPAFPPPKRITLKGRFIGKDGAPKKGVKVEVCQGISAVYYGKTPCDGKQPMWKTTSGADGTFTFADLPAGGWAINYSTGKDWVVRLDYAWKNVGNDRVLDDFQL